MCFTWSVCVLLFLLCCFYFLNKLDPSILVWERDTLRFFMWILIFFTYIFWVFLSSYCYAFSSCFSCISFRAVNSCGKYSLVSFVKLLGELLGWCVGSENVACGSGIMKNLHNLVDHWTLITWFFANVLRYLDGKACWLIKLKSLVDCCL